MGHEAVNDPAIEATQTYASAVKRAAIDYAAGCLGGVMGIIVGQPFDTIKVRLQTHGAHYTSPWHCARHTVQHEGVRGLFKGLASPLVGSVPINALVFGVHGSTLRALDSAAMPSLSSVFYAGSIAGFVQSFVVAPTDLVKCQLQVQDGYTHTHTFPYPLYHSCVFSLFLACSFQRGGRRTFAGPMDCIRHITATHGARGMFQGLWPTILRDTFSYGVYFYVYEATLRHLEARREALNATSQQAASMLFAGGCAGVVSWSIIYPLDVVKSVIQSQPSTSDLGLVRHAHTLYREHGWRVFTKGLGTTILRAFPVNAVTFYVYEETMTALS
ncbi:hypothetical protein DYB37_002870 [Aphanomyces astaci]|uniref:Uncharacterized protein n=2 Tax=Aphanomyces astaci TaxID=112090 RepID=A0A3R7BAP3_APHAT|nr:hypothetical protein DYB37_002870 [Aphanomyces astaci]